MEQTRYWMWTREGISATLPNNTVAAGSSSESWEEQAFAADSAGHLGGCIWPPKSYTCSFCGREFRSAQALGGHMNVHRRDRARLKQSPTAISENHDDYGHHQLDPCKPLKGQHTPQLCPDTYDPNPGPSEDLGVTAPPFSPSRVSVISQETRRECNLIPRAHSSYISRGDIQENPKESLSSTPKPLMDSMAVRELTVAELKLGRDNWRLTDVSYLRERDTSKDHEEVPSSKRRRTDPVLASTNKEILRSEVLKLVPSTFEELDLELRLGDRPAVR